MDNRQANIIFDFQQSSENDYSHFSYQGKAKDLDVHLIEKAAHNQNLEVIKHKKTTIELRSSSRVITFNQNALNASVIETHITSRWALTKKLLKENNLPVPKGKVFDNIQSAEKYFLSLNIPQSLKKLRNANHQTPALLIDNVESLRENWQQLREKNPLLLMEDYPEGESLNLLLIGAKVVAAYISQPATIIGDGKSTLRQLLRIKNQSRKNNPRLALKPIKYTGKYLRENIKLNSVPDTDQVIPVHSISSKAVEDDILEVSDFIDGSFIRLAEQAVNSIPALKYAEITINYQQLDQPVDTQKALITDIDSAPSMLAAVFPNYGKSHDIAAMIIAYAFDNYDSIAKDNGLPLSKAAPYREEDSAEGLTKGYDLQMEVLKQAAHRRNLQVKEISHTVYSVVGDSHQVTFKHAMTELTPTISRRVSNNKTWTKKLLKDFGIKSPEGQFFSIDDQQSAWKFAQDLCVPVVVKPQSGSGGKGVTTDISTKEHFQLAWEIARNTKSSRTIMVEEYIAGNDHRVYVIGGSVVSVTERLPAYLVGDGKHTINELIEIKNQSRVSNPHVGGLMIGLTPIIERNLAALDLTPDSILDKEQFVQLHAVANIGRGGESKDVTDNMHPEFAKIAVRAKMAIFNPLNAGVDILAEDISKPPSAQRWCVIEVNTDPHIALHHFPLQGTPRDAAGAFIEYLFPETRGKTPSKLGVKITINGKVQRVGYRKWLKRNALLRGINGWIRNLSNGSVEGQLCGTEHAVAELLKLCERGPKNAAIDTLEVNRINDNPTAGFQILKTV